MKMKEFLDINLFLQETPEKIIIIVKTFKILSIYIKESTGTYTGKQIIEGFAACCLFMRKFRKIYWKIHVSMVIGF